jgi:carbamoylphosphate synthase large subunit
MKSITDNFSVLIPDGEFYFLISIVDSLSSIKGIKIYVMSDVRHTGIRYSRYVRNFSYYPKTTNDLEWISYVNREVEMHKIDVILPVHGKRIGTLIYHKRHLTYGNKLALTPIPRFYEIASDKWLLAKHMEEFNINFPKSFVTTPNEHGWEENMSIEFPIIIKPAKDSSGGVGIFKFENETELHAHLKNKTMDKVHLVQEYIDGYDIDCSVLCKMGEILAFTMQKGTMQGKNAFVPQLGIEIIHEPKLFETVRRLMESLNWSGIAHVDLRYDKKSETFKVLEINPRFWMTLQASLMAGINFPYLMCLNTLGINYKVPEYENVDYLNLKGLFQKIGNNILFIFRWKYIYKNTELKYVFKDPLPIVVKFIWRTRNILRRKYGKNF